LVDKLAIASHDPRVTNHTKMERDQDYLIHMELLGRYYISRMAAARDINFCTQVGYMKYWPWSVILPRNGRGQGHVTHF